MSFLSLVYNVMVIIIIIIYAVQCNIDVDDLLKSFDATFSVIIF